MILLLLLIMIPNFLQTSYSQQINVPVPDCIPSSCGDIHNISSPFRLRDDPTHCGDPSYQLQCQNNTTFLYFHSHKYLVREINYDNYTIRLSDASIKTDTSCSFPEHSLSGSSFDSRHPYPYSKYLQKYPYSNTVIGFISCPHPVNSSYVYLEASECFNDSHTTRHTYIQLSDGFFFPIGDEFYMCRIDAMIMTSLPKLVDLENGELRNTSLSDIHRALLYGFELSWFNALCSEKCKYECLLDGSTPRRSDQLDCNFHLHQYWSIVCYGRAPFWFYKALHWFNSILQVIGVLVEIYFAGRILIGVPFMLGLLIYKLRRRHLSMFDGIEGFLQSNNNLMPIRYSYSNIKQMTGNLKEKLGEGGYGSLYKGKLRSGHDVAVKILNNKPGATGQEFINEIATIGRIHHVNVVKLVGYCVEGSKCALIYDFMPRGSLEQYIYRDETSNSLNWEQKYEITVGVARGIEYLHQGCDIQILHFDIKPHNILLDDSFTPKVSDFGLAKFYPTDNVTVTLTMARGTIGYVAPELINRSIGRVSYKADVYSFGMLLMEMLRLNRDMVADDDKSSQYFPYWIYDRFNKGKDIETGNADKIDDEEDDDFTRKVKKKMTIVALWCIRMSPEDRPSMSEVVKMLESENENLKIPPQPSQSAQVAANGDQSWETESTDSIALLGTSYASSGVSE